MKQTKRIAVTKYESTTPPGRMWRSLDEKIEEAREIQRNPGKAQGKQSQPRKSR
jgi:hypothetical protein